MSRSLLTKLTMVGVLCLLGCFDFNEAKQMCLDPEKGDCIAADGPTLSESTPSNLATEVAVDSAFTLTFSQPMETASLDVTFTPAVSLSSPVWDDEGLIATVQPLAALQYNTQYTVQVRGRSTAGKPLPSGSAFSFTTLSAPDNEAPTLTSSLPSNNATNVPVGLQLVLDFSERMSVDSLVVDAQPAYDFGPPTWSNGDRKATFTMSPGALEAMTTYFLSVEASDAAGNPLTGNKTLSFTTGTPPDTTRPTVIATAPAAGSMGVSTNAALSVTFSERMNASTLGAFSISPNVTCNLAFDVTGTLLTCPHASQQLTASTVYTITISTAARDEANNAMETPFSFSFTTGAVADTTPPTLVSTSPTNAGTGAATRPAIKAVFSEAMDKAVTQAAFAISSPAGVTGAFSWNAAGTELTFVPTNAFSYGQSVQWQIGNNAADLAGQKLGTTQQRQFRVVYQGSRTIYSLAAEDGYLRLLSGAYVAYGSSVYFNAGDGLSGAAYRGFLSFDLSVLPAGTSSVTDAKLYVYQAGTSGTPYDSAHGSVVLERIKYEVKPSIPSTAWSSAAIPVKGRCTGFLCATVSTATVSTTNAVGVKTVSVTGFVDDALAEKKVQFRFRFSKADSDGDSTADFGYFATSDWATSPDRKPYLVLTYEYP